MKRLFDPLFSYSPLHSAAPALAVALALVACGDDGAKPAAGNDVTADTSNTGGQDTTPGPDIVGEDPTLIDPDIRCDRRGFDIQNQSVSVRDGVTRYGASNAMNPPADILAIEIFAGGDFNGATGPGTYKLDDPNYATCSNCVLIQANCTDKGCDKVFYADVGSLRLDAFDPTGGAFTGRLQGAVLREVTIDPKTFESALVPGGETWCINDFEFAAEIKGLPVSDRTQPNCVAEGTGVYLEDNIKNITWTNCLGEEVKLHDTCGQKKALWLIATAGWCSACKDFIANLVAEHGGSLSRENVGTKQPGLDIIIVLGEDARSNKPTLAYCMQYATQSKLDPAMVVIDWTDEKTQIPLVDPEGYAVGLNSLGITWAAINPYLTADAEGSVASGYPWWGLLDARNMSYVWSDYAERDSFSVTLNRLLSAP